MEEENQQVTPCFSDDGINYMHIRHNNLYCESWYGYGNRVAPSKGLVVG